MEGAAMALKETYVRARIDTSTKARAEHALAAMGLSVSGAIRLFMPAAVNEQIPPLRLAKGEREFADSAPVGTTELSTHAQKPWSDGRG
jgi:addiction module RelB/DinJ family antitoxin